MLRQDTPIKIIENLYLGSFCAADYKILTKNNITSVVCLTASAHVYPKEIDLLHINNISEALTEESFTLDKLVKALCFIKSHINNNQNVLVHCKAGVSRSATVVVAYVMQDQKLNVHDAINFVMQIAPHINPCFSRLLNEFYSSLSDADLK